MNEQQWKPRLRLRKSLKEAFPQRSNLLLLPLFLFAISCTTIPKNFNDHKEGSWRAKSLIQDLKRGKSFVVYMDINAIKPDKVRLDVETSLGIHVASMVYNKNKVQVLIPPKKKFYKGKASPRALRKVIPMDIDPKWLVDVLFENDMEKSGWECSRDKNNYFKECKREGIALTWLQRKREMRVVSFVAKDAKVQLQLKGFEPKSKEPGFFKLPTPAGFKVYRLK